MANLTPLDNLTAEQVRHRFNYDPATGVLRWAISPSKNVKAGDVAGSSHGDGYLRVRIGASRYLVHRIIWLHHYGKWPDGHVDHLDGEKRNNRVSNMRDSTRSVNAQNQRSASANNKAKLLGVAMRPNGKCVAAINVCGKKMYLGIFRDPQEAHSTYLEAKRRLHAGNTL